MQYGDFASVYDGLMYDVPYERWAAFITEKLAGCRKITELACGTGSVTRLLARKFDVTAMDLSETMLEVAAEKLRKEGLRPRFVCGDLRSFALHQPADAAVCVCDGFNYLLTPEDVRQAFRAVKKSLKPGGLLIFDVSSAKKLRGMDGQFYSEDNDQVTYLWHNVFDEATHCLTMDLTFFVNQKENTYVRFDETHVQRAHERAELEAWLKEAGFEVLTVTDDYTDAPAREDSIRLTFIAKAL